MDTRTNNTQSSSSDPTLYQRYVSLLSSPNPRVLNVLDFVLGSGLEGRRTLDGTLFHGSVITTSSENKLEVAFFTTNGQEDCDGVKRRIDRALAATGGDSRDLGVIIAQDIQPEGVRYLGQSYGIDPENFEQYLNREAFFQSKGPPCFVFDYPETYQSNSLNLAKHPDDLFGARPNSRPGTLVRLWMNIYGYFQRIVWIITPHLSSGQNVHILLVDSLPSIKETTTFHLSRKWATFNKFAQVGEQAMLAGSESPSCFQILESNILTMHTSQTGSSSIIQARVAEAIMDLLCKKWGIMLQRVQEKISESKDPLTGNLTEIEEVLQRKHDFEKLQRTISATIKSAQGVSLDTTTTTTRETSVIKELRDFERSIGSWATQLEKVSDSMLGMLALSESLKAAGQAMRSQNLQLLAFVFIPVSTVSSIYGMNTFEINGGSPRMWQFGVAAVSTTVLAAVVAWLYHYIRIPHAFKFFGISEPGDVQPFAMEKQRKIRSTRPYMPTHPSPRSIPAVHMNPALETPTSHHGRNPPANSISNHSQSYLIPDSITTTNMPLTRGYQVQRRGNAFHGGQPSLGPHLPQQQTPYPLLQQLQPQARYRGGYGSQLDYEPGFSDPWSPHAQDIPTELLPSSACVIM